MTREEALKIVEEMLQNQNLVKHCLAVEAIMRALCRYLRDRHPERSEGSLANASSDKLRDSSAMPQNDNVNEFDEEEWGIVGLLHDADYEVTNKDLETHTDVIVAKLRELNAPERIIQGILGHHELKKPNRENYLEKSIYAVDELSGLITACTLVRPDRKLASVTVESVMKKFKQPAFAAGARRDQILRCEPDLDIPLEEFVKIALEAMQGISDELGL